MTTKTEIDCELLLRWAYDELSKRKLSAAEGIWNQIEEYGQRGGIDLGQHGAAQRYSHFGLPDPDAERVERAVAELEDVVIDWEQSFATIAPDLGALISVNDLSPRPAKRPKAGWGPSGTKALQAWWGKEGAQPVRERPRDVMMVGRLRTAALVTMHAVRGTRPDWREELPKPVRVPAERGQNAAIVGECRGKNLYSTGSYCPLKWEPSPLAIVSSRAEYVAWRHGLVVLAKHLSLAKFAVLPPKVSATPWLDEAREEESRVLPVVPNGKNDVAAWGKLPLKPARPKAGPPLHSDPKDRQWPADWPAAAAC